FFIDGRFAWLYDGGWTRSLGYAQDSLVSDVTLSHARLGISVRFEDYVDLARNWFIRNLVVTSAAGFNSGAVFFHYDWFIDGSDIGNTVLFDPRHRGVIAYKADRYFLLGGQSGEEYGISSWANGKKGNEAAGTWVDAQDGVLGRNPIEQGAVDCTVSFDLERVEAGKSRSLTHWLCMGTRLSEVTAFGQDLIVSRGPDTYRDRTITYWQVWSEKDHRHIDEALVEEGFFLHKYTPYGLPGSSWLPWVDSHGARTLPVQEDETGLVLWALWQHYRIHRNLDFVVGLYSTLIVPAADWMASYVDSRN